jgi:hypothetical protein
MNAEHFASLSSHEHVMKLLKNYRSYRFAVNNGIAPYVEEDRVGMPRNGGYGSFEPTLFRGSIDLVTKDYRKYKRVVELIQSAVDDVLDDDSQRVIRFRYMDRNALTFEEISDRLNSSRARVYRLHDKAIFHLSVALRFVDAPAIHNLDAVLA